MLVYVEAILEADPNLLKLSRIVNEEAAIEYLAFDINAWLVAERVADIQDVVTSASEIRGLVNLVY